LAYWAIQNPGLFGGAVAIAVVYFTLKFLSARG
jgi:hypothetical protein